MPDPLVVIVSIFIVAMALAIGERWWRERPSFSRRVEQPSPVCKQRFQDWVAFEFDQIWKED